MSSRYTSQYNNPMVNNNNVRNLITINSVKARQNANKARQAEINSLIQAREAAATQAHNAAVKKANQAVPKNNK